MLPKSKKNEKGNLKKKTLPNECVQSGLHTNMSACIEIVHFGTEQKIISKEKIINLKDTLLEHC